MRAEAAALGYEVLEGLNLIHLSTSREHAGWSRGKRVVKTDRESGNHFLAPKNAFREDNPLMLC